MNNNIINETLKEVYSYLLDKYSNDELRIITNELKSIVSFDETSFIVKPKKFSSYEQTQLILSRINEKSDARKNNGVYYTANDVVKFIYANTIKSLYGIIKPSNLHVLDLNGIPYNSLCFYKKVFDPTCGTGEFLLVALSIKLDLLDLHKRHVSNANIINVMDTIYGNDINEESIIITKIRLYLYVLNRYGVERTIGICKKMIDKFFSIDFINKPNNFDKKFEIIIGNPPYVEDSKCNTIPLKKYGNVYANVLDNSISILSDNGAIGFVIPLSYVSTPRMKIIRNVLLNNLNDQYILSYCDRPDCLFPGVHQKLCILIGNKKSNRQTHKIFTSDYKFWYKEERERLFENTSTVLNLRYNEDYIPKLGNEMEVSIFDKIVSKEIKLYDALQSGTESIYLNMRAAFWIKAFMQEHNSGEYKKYQCKNKNWKDLIMCVTNSSLFWWYWVCTSDCWHITHKELKGFTIPNIDFSSAVSRNLSKLAKNLEKQLEKTKKYVGTKQTEYEYKHKDCVNEIHLIDDFVNELYGLTEEESLYVKNFAYIYRVSGGAL